jgi:hypothetical protein
MEDFAHYAKQSISPTQGVLNAVALIEKFSKMWYLRHTV